MKLFEIIDDGEKYWYAAETQDEAIITHEDYINMGLNEGSEWTCIKEIPETEWENMKVKYDEPDENGDNLVLTFKEAMEGVATPEQIASTIY